MYITIDQALSWKPCDRYGDTDDEIRAKLLKISGGRESVSLLEVFDLPIPPADIQWLLLREDVLPANLLHEFGCWCAEVALMAERDAGREPHADSWRATQVKRLWIKGQASEEQLTAAYAAADAAADAAAHAARAAYAAARAAAYAAAYAEQNRKLKEMIGGLLCTTSQQVR